jgi:hypothetical protein
MLDSHRGHGHGGRRNGKRTSVYSSAIGNGLSIAQVLTSTQRIAGPNSQDHNENYQHQQRVTTLSRSSATAANSTQSKTKHTSLNTRGMPPLRERLLAAFATKAYGANGSRLAMAAPQSNSQLVATDGFYFQQRHGKLNLRGIARLDLEKVRARVLQFIHLTTSWILAMHGLVLGVLHYDLFNALVPSMLTQLVQFNSSKHSDVLTLSKQHGRKLSDVTCHPYGKYARY